MFRKVLFSPLRKWSLRRCALRCKDERRRLDAARQLNDQKILKQIAIEANDAVIRFKAAESVEHQAFLVAIALNAGDIEQGRAVVGRIHHNLLLRRVATAARQDAVRLEAARKLTDVKHLKQVARTTNDIVLCWEVARELDDPDLLAKVALFNPSSEHFESLRLRARKALIVRLDDLGRQNDENKLLTFILFQPHLPFKLRAFLCLPTRAIHRQLLQHMASQDYQFISGQMILKMLAKIESAGWRLKGGNRQFSCTCCHGKAILSWKVSWPGQSISGSRPGGGTDCRGKGRLNLFVVGCRDPHGRVVEFRLPSSCAFCSEGVSDGKVAWPHEA